MTLQEIAKTVRAADGSFEVALSILMSTFDPAQKNGSSGPDNDSSASSAPHSSSDTQDLEFDKKADIIRLKTQFSRQFKEVVAVIGEGVQDEEVILQTIEKVKGDAQEAILQLLSMPSAEQPSHSETSSSRDALRVSANHISATSTLRTSSGIEELPINVNLNYLNDLSSTASTDLPYPSSMTSVHITPAAQVHSQPALKADSSPPAEVLIATPAASSADASISTLPSTISSATTVSAPPEAIKKNTSLRTSAHIGCGGSDGFQSDGSIDIENAEWGVIEYDEEEYGDDDFDSFEDDSTASSLSYYDLDDEIKDAERDFLTIMLQEEYDAMLAGLLEQQMKAGIDSLPLVPPPVPDRYGDKVSVRAAPSYIPSQQSHPAPNHPAASSDSYSRYPWARPLSRPVVPDPAQPCFPKFQRDGVPKKKQIPSGPKYYPRSFSSESSAPLAVPSSSVEASTQVDKNLLAQFVAAHPVIDNTPTTTANGRPAPNRRQRANNEPIRALIRTPKLGDGLALAHAVRKLKQLYQARLAAIAPVKKKQKKESVVDKPVDQAVATPELAADAQADCGAVDSQTGAPALFDISDYVTRMFEQARYKEPHELIAIQQNELRSLRNLFSSDRLLVSESVPTVVCLSLSDPSFEISRSVPLKAKGEDVAQLVTSVSFQNPLFLQLVAALPPFYPDVAPSISVRSMTPNCPVNPADLARLEAHLKKVVSDSAGSPCLAHLVTEAETWLCDDLTIRKAMLADYHNLNSTAATQAEEKYEHQIFASLNKLFNFERDYSILDTHDVLNQRSKLLKRAILLLINGRSVLYGPTPGNPENEAQQFPILDISTGEIDEEASLRGIGLTPGAVRIILQHYNWNLGKLSTAYLGAVARGTYETFLSDAGVAPIEDRFAMQHHLPRAVTEIMECPTCLDTRPFHAMFGLVCGHMLCKQCYCDYVDYELSSGSGLSHLTCPSPGCKYTIDQASLAGLLSPERWSSYVGMVVSQFVQASPALRWCPSGKGCERIVQEGALDSDGVSRVLAGEQSDDSHIKLDNPIPHAATADQTPLVIQCHCSYTFCNSCGRVGGHFPASCTECNAWDKAHHEDAPLRDKALDEALSAQFLRTHTRGCPNCTASISKNGGCVHMNCVACKYEFCWVCGHRWNSTHYACSESSIDWSNTSSSFTVRYRNFDSLLARHREHSFPAISSLREQLVNAIYREDKSTKKSMPGANAINNKNVELSKPISFEDVPAFIDAIELLFLADYVVTNACKAGFSLAEQGISSSAERSALLSSLLRALDDIAFLCNSFRISPLRKEHVHFVSAGCGQLKTSIKIVVDSLSSIRMAHLGQLSRAKSD